jgi:predicted NBD/HSP70 family sugar kinase
MIVDRATGASVEDLCSGSALRRIAGRDPRQTVEAARNDHPAAVQQIAQITDALAVAILNLVYCYMPDRVVIGGGMAQAGALFLDPIRAHITEAGVGLSLSADGIVLAEHGNDVGLLGGYALGTDAFLSDIGSHGIVITTPAASPAQPRLWCLKTSSRGGSDLHSHRI